MPDQTPTLTIPHRFRGPASSGNGGWTSGALAAHLAHPARQARGPVQVMLREPPPLDVALDVVRDAGSATATQDDVVIAVATRSEAALAPVEAVSAEAARAAEGAYLGLDSHPFPTCFSCGTAREAADGLRIFPGRVDDDTAGRTRVAATWTPDPSLRSGGGSSSGQATATLPITWAALDCIGGWAGNLTERLMVLGSMTAHVLEAPQIGVEHVVVGGDRGTSGRRTFTSSTLYDASGRALGWAEHVWFAIDPKDFA